MRRLARYLLVVGAMVGMPGGCVSDTADKGSENEDAGVAQEIVSHDHAPTEAELCSIPFGFAHRADVESVLGKPVTTRETEDRVILLYEYDDGVTLALHLDSDVFRDFSVYGANVPQCWAQAKRIAMESPLSADAGAATDTQTQ